MQTEEQKPKKNLSAAQMFYAEIKALKPGLKKGWRDKFFNLQPSYDNAKGVNKLNNVLSFVATDQVILDTLREIVKGGESDNS